jgi:hypothetical protein
MAMPASATMSATIRIGVSRSMPAIAVSTATQAGYV